ncbi:unnamed protein product [Thlaspi arvense]|uniref:TF-B3 domain-containing protein n=1 Tax=Thlaspi arvense TaxID=13288 RepID=A0AAU9SXI2_THLAR|nr:unnamed protein product [Thlaspi arvense]
MANASLYSPINPHFFQPLVPGFQSHLNIPVKFFSEHIEGKHENKTLKLRSDASEKSWEVKIEGKRLTRGWKEFVEAHNLRMGDFVIFRHEGDVLFHVTAFGPSCCGIQYAPSGSRDEEEDEVKIETSSSSEKEVEENLTAESNQSSSDLNCFRQSVTASNISRDTVGLPAAFAKRNSLNKESQDIVLMNEQGRSWPSETKCVVSGRVFIVRGWTRFCTANKLQVGDSCTFTLLQGPEKPVFQLCSRSKEEQKKKIPAVEENTGDDKTGEIRFLKLTPTTKSLELGKQHLPVIFTRANKLINPGIIVLVDKDGAEWSMKLSKEKSSEMMYIMSGSGWKSFCAANDVGAGESLILELIRGGVSPLLQFCSNMEQRPSFIAESRAYKRARVQKCSHETRPKLETREKTYETGEPSRRSTRAPNKTNDNQGNLQNTETCSLSEQVAKVKRCVVATLTSIRRFREELEIMEQKLEDSWQEINNLVPCLETESQRGEDKVE